MVAPAAPAVGDVLGLVERCERCDGSGRIGVVGPPCGHCHDDPAARLFGGGVKSGAGYLLTGFVKVVEVLPIVSIADEVVRVPQPRERDFGSEDEEDVA